MTSIGCREGDLFTSNDLPVHPETRRGLRNILGTRKRDQEDIFSLGPRKKHAHTDPLVLHGRHFGRTIRAFCRVQALITQGLSIDVQIELGDITREDLSSQIYHQLLALSPKLEERLCTGSEEDVFHIAALITKGATNARSDDTRALKSIIIDWITPRGELLLPPLQRNIKTNRGFHHDRTGQLLCPVTMDWTCIHTRQRLRSRELVPTGEQWPLFLYENYIFDAENPWRGLLRGPLLVKAYKYVFTSPSSVDGGKDSSKATRASNSRIHGMKTVSNASLAYIATQVRFALTASPTFSRTDHETDSEKFYNSVLRLLEDPEEWDEVKLLLGWWDRETEPGHSSSTTQDSVYARIKEKRRRDQGSRLEQEGLSLEQSNSPSD
ncbi:hypothetical protein BKA70DRAFT_1234416 [Coprinopsis sp. MPI-PUGE-AT-0042]|nr:hypothetical protein BKA70DRAFT_1234416 [Coprinopsis sp. MPI-PUGE-AT-0042]